MQYKVIKVFHYILSYYTWSWSIYDVKNISEAPVSVCEPSPCGPNSQCREVNGHAVCVCIQGYIGSPPNCRPECTISSDCKLNQACSNQKCIDPCPGACGRNTHCIVVNHNPICTCFSGYSGDPFTMCQLIRKYWNDTFRNIVLILYCIC